MRLFLIDKDFNELSLIRKYFLNAKVHLCLFHTLKVFNKKTQSMPSNERETVRKLITALVYSASKDDYAANLALLKAHAPSNFTEYFLANWDNCKDMWVSYERNLCNNFDNHTTNRLESYHQKLKRILERRKGLVEVIKAVTLLSSTKELLNDHLRFLQKSVPVLQHKAYELK